MLISRFNEVFPLLCQHFGTEMRIVAFITKAWPVQFPWGNRRAAKEHVP